LETKANVVSVLARIEKLLERPVDVSGTSFLPRAEMGIALHPTDGDEPDALLSNASAARNFTDHQPANHRFSFYSEKMNELARELLTTEAEMQKALEQDELELWYQPKVSSESGRIEGLEALVRWRHPVRGIVFPDKFIPIAEQSDLINRIGLWVIKAACRQLEQWNNTPLRDIRIAVNVSPRQFLDAHFIDHVDTILEAHPDAPAHLDIELTEGVLLSKPEHAKKIMETLASRGMHLYLDDFGTGYASLGYLKHLPLHALKIDRSFTQEIVSSSQERAIVGSIINVANGLNLGVVAEGIESEDQLRVMSELGCKEFQGYYFSRPIPAEDIVGFIDKMHNAA
jgi:EAL domain-containing protein (putative c-di-GMP-specific phosphodiesterase class I)